MRFQAIHSTTFFSRVSQPLLRALAASATLLLCATSSAQNLVVNPGFEASAEGSQPTAWTFAAAATGSLALVYGDHPSPYNPHSGAHSYLFAGVDQLLDTISQSIATTAGSLYEVGLWVHSDGNAPSALLASFGNTVVLSLVDPATADGSVERGYVHYMTTVLATSSATTFAIGGFNVPGGLVLDDVSVAAVSAVPEPESLALLVAGMGALILRARKSATRRIRSATTS